MSKVIGLIGEMASGKSTATLYLKKNFGAITFQFSGALRDILKRLGIEESRGNMQALSTSLRQTFGDDLLAKAMYTAVKDASAELIIVEGIRRPADVKFLTQLPNFKMVFLSVTERTRYERLVKRRENPDDVNKIWEQFQADGKLEAEQKIKEIAAGAEVIDNNGSMENFEQALSRLVTQ